MSGQQENYQEMVRAANQRFYDAVAGHYEGLDGRRSPALKQWLSKKMLSLRSQSPGGVLLDLGAGSGLLARCSQGIFAPRVAVDISSVILAAHRDVFDLGVAADVTALPFSDDSFDTVACFAVLHHLYAFQEMVTEVARVLKPGGLFYSDHDMEATFYRRFRLPLLLYRSLHDSRKKYLTAVPTLTEELYDLSEWHANGIEAAALAQLFREAGFIVRTSFHWFGLNVLTDRLFGELTFSEGWGPLLSILAVKQG